MSHPSALSSDISSSSPNITTTSDNVILQKRPPKLSEIKHTSHITLSDRSDNLSNIVESLRIKWALLVQQFSNREPTLDSSFPKEQSTDNCDPLISDFSLEDSTNEQDFSSLLAIKFRGCAREILEELETLISASTPGGVVSIEDDNITPQSMEEWMQSLVEHYYQQQMYATGCALECIASSTVDAVITKSVMFLMVEDYKEREQHHLRAIMDTIDNTFPKGTGERNVRPSLTISMVESHVKGRLKHFKKKLDKVQANNSILDWVQGTQTVDNNDLPHNRGIISWLLTASSNSSSSSEDEAYSFPRIKSVPRDQQNTELDTSLNISEFFDPRRSLSDVTFSFSRQASRELSMLLQSEPTIYRRYSDSSCLSSSFPSNFTEKAACSADCSRSLGKRKESSKQSKSESSHRLSVEIIQEQTSANIATEATESVKIEEIQPVIREIDEQSLTTELEQSVPNEENIQSNGGVKMRQGILLSQYSSSTELLDSNLSAYNRKRQAKRTQSEVIDPQQIIPTQPARRKGSRGLLKATRSKDKCVEFDLNEYLMPALHEVDLVEQAYLHEVHQDIMRSNIMNRKKLSFNVGDGILDDLCPDSITMPLPYTDSIYNKTSDTDIGEEFEKFEQDWRAFQVAFEADVFSTRHRLRQSRINLNRKLERMHEYSSCLDECIAILAQSVTQDTFFELEETFRANLISLITSMDEVVVTAEMVGCLSQQHEDDSNFQLCFKYVDKLKYRSNTIDKIRTEGRAPPQPQESTISNSDSVILNEDMVQIAIERFMTQPAQESRWPSFPKEHSHFISQQSQVTRELKQIMKNYDGLVKSCKREMRWSRVSIILILLLLLLMFLLLITFESIEHSFNALLINLRLV
ncbi:hypothetical protein LOD99_13172 [Oopsacas minuta]|uniref:Uncharacterized protein n=1 Tax=Oopsacas minuta TaxID=111878 RepID=A0AAV7JB17_9METZ|nr:hypothetical protein LOD99_13172 [Oopsacas minuta]